MIVIGENFGKYSNPKWNLLWFESISVEGDYFRVKLNFDKLEDWESKALKILEKK